MTANLNCNYSKQNYQHPPPFLQKSIIQISESVPDNESGIQKSRSSNKSTINALQYQNF